MLKGKLSMLIVFSLIVALTGSLGVFLAINMTKANKINKTKIEFNILKDTKEYDGLPLELSINNLELVDEDALPSGYTFDFVCNDTITNEGFITPNPNIIIYDKEGKNVTNSYNCVISENGGLQVEKRSIKVNYDSASKAYDGTPLNITTVSVVEGDLVKGQKISPVFRSSATTQEEGAVNIVADTHIFDVAGFDVTDNYLITDNLSGDSIPTFSITGYKVTIITKDAYKVYDGKPLYNRSVTQQGLREGDEIVVLDSKEIIDVSDSGTKNTILKEDIDIIDLDGKSVKDMYEIVVHNDGILTIDPYVITLSVISDEPVAKVPYDGQKHTFAISTEELDNLLSNKDKELLQDSYLAGEGSDSAVDAGPYPVELSIRTKYGDINQNFDLNPSYRDKLYFEIEKSVVNITLNPIIETFNNKIYKYDADDPDCYTRDGFINEDAGHRLIFNYDSQTSRKDVGETIVEATAKIVDEDGNDGVGANYKINITQGLIRINPREVTISLKPGETAKFEYGDDVKDASSLLRTSDTKFTYNLSYKANVNFNEIKSYDLNDVLNITVKDGLTELSISNFAFNISDFIVIEKRNVDVKKKSDAIITKDYTGENLFSNASDIYEINDELFVFNLNFTRTFIDPGEYLAKNFLNITINSDDISKFSFDIKDVTLTINDENVTLKIKLKDGINSSYSADNPYKTYDGVAVYATDIYELDSDSRAYLQAKNYTCTYNFNSVIVDAGTYNPQLNLSVKDKNGQSVTIDWEYLGGNQLQNLVISKRSITITTGSASKVYDGLPLFLHEYTVSNLPSNFDFVVIEWEEGIINVNENSDHDENNELSYRILLDNAPVNTSNFKVRATFGTLTVYKAILNIYMNDKTITYGDDVDDLVLSYSTTGSGTNIVTAYSIVPVADTDERIITARVDGLLDSNCKVNIYDGQLIINKKKITVQTASASKEYDGTTLEYPYFINDISSQLVSGDTFSISYYSSITDVGSISNMITINLQDSEDNDITDYYDITYIYGTLTVTKKMIIARTNDITVDLTSGDSLSNHSRVMNVYDLNENPVDMSLFNIVSISVSEVIGTSKDNTIIITNNSNYEIIYVYGTINFI
ncbi:MAG: hypothetical protein K6E87_01715 [bacterium]|nr:hypothetical protein [bacterium]